MDDEVLVRRCQAGDREAFAALFHRHADPVLRVAYLITGSHAVAEEVMQESFAQAFRFMGGLRNIGAFRNWLYRIAVRQARKSAARERTARLAGDRYARQEHGVAAPPADPDGQEVVWACISRLPEKQRTALVIHYFLGRPVAEVAEIMGAPVGSVKVWLHRARTALAAELKLAGGGMYHG